MSRAACILGCSGQRLTKNEKSLFSELNPVGFILFTRNANDNGEIKYLIEELKEISDLNTIIVTDQEGGRVQRFTGIGWSNWLPALDQCDRVDSKHRLRALWLRYRIIASELNTHGINMNCVPVGDVATEATHPTLRNRCYSQDPEFVSKACQVVVDACLVGGVLPVVKHIPGHGRLSEDSHHKLPKTNVLMKELFDTDFRPFKSLRNCPFGMMSHVLYSSIDSFYPASQSPKIISMVRDEIGFDGLLMTDDLSMLALNGSMNDRTIKCAAAGCDIVLHCNGDFEEMKSVADAVGQLPEADEVRIKQAIGSVQDVNNYVFEYKKELTEICNQAGIIWH